MLEKLSIHAFIEKFGIKTDTGVPLDFKNHPFMWEIYSDMSPKQVILKAAQVTMSTCATLKSFWVAKNRGMDIIYTLPSESDRNTFVGGKVNRIIAQNPVLLEWTKDKDSVEQKQISDNFIHYRGTWTQRAAIMVPSDLNIYDELDASKQDVIEQYATRLQHSKFKWEWYFSHPSASGFGVDKYWQLSDQKHWLIKCDSGHEQYLDWPDSVNTEKQTFQCKVCKTELSDDNRRRGRWAKKKDKKDSEFSGYWINLMMCPWITAKDILNYHKEKTEEYFYNFVLGKPYVGGGNKLTWELFAKNLTSEILTPTSDEPMVIGVDTGLKLDYVMGSKYGLFYHGEANDYSELDKHMQRWPKAIAVVDAGGDLIGSRAFKEKWKGRVFLCFLGSDRKTEELVKWGQGDEYNTCRADRDRMIQLVVDEFRSGRIKVQGTPEDWHDYWTDWNNLTRIKVEDATTLQHKGFKWVRSGRDHRAAATWFWRVGMMRFGYDKASFIEEDTMLASVEPYVYANQTVKSVTAGGQDIVQATTNSLKYEHEEEDWRNV